MLTNSDHRKIPGSFTTAIPRLGYDEGELTRPFAHFYRDEVGPLQPHVADALLARRRPAEFGYDIGEAAQRLDRNGYDRMETGWARTERGTLMIACLTDMPGVTAEMWDWWFGWHGTDSARYKLWHPAAHRLAALADDRSHDRTLTDRQRYQNNVSYVDEYIGATPSRLAIRFVEPASLGLTEPPGTTHICARVGPANLPVAVGWLVHQVRPTDDGSEMRSRFFLGHPQALDGVLSRVLKSRGGRMILEPASRIAARTVVGDEFGYALLHHCASEMNHLAGFLADLYAEFRGTP